MTTNDIKQQVSETTAKKVEVFVGGAYAPNFEIRTESQTTMALAFKAAAQQ